MARLCRRLWGGTGLKTAAKEARPLHPMLPNADHSPPSCLGRKAFATVS